MMYRGKDRSIEELAEIAKGMHGDEAPTMEAINSRLFRHGVGRPWTVEAAVETTVQGKRLIPYRGGLKTYQQLAQIALGLHGRRAPTVRLIQKRVQSGKSAEAAVEKPARKFEKKSEYWRLRNERPSAARSVD